MSDKSLIEWTDATWNPITGCSIVSPGCTHCYAMKLAGGRLQHHPSRVGLTQLSKAGPVWTGKVRFNEGMLLDPLKWKRPRKIFVCAHGDLFAEGVPDEWIDKVFAVMALCPQHVFQVLTKRPERMREYLAGQPTGRRFYEQSCDMVLERQLRVVLLAPGIADPGLFPKWPRIHLGQWPLANVWLGVSAEDQKRADERIPQLLATPAAKRFVSLEPLLGPINAAWALSRNLLDLGAGFLERGHFAPGLETLRRLEWVIVGGESGTGARPMSAVWPRSLRDQCQSTGVPFFFKQWGTWIDADEKFDAIERGGAFIQKDGKVWQPPQPLNFTHAAELARILNHPIEHHSDGSSSILVSKALAGRLLDGVEHNGMPA